MSMATDASPPLDLSHHLSRSTAARQASSIKQFYKYFAIPGIGQLAGGLPNNHYFPFDTLEAKIAQPDRWTPTPNKPIDPPPNNNNNNNQVEVTAEKWLANLSLGVGGGPKKNSQSAILVPHTSPQRNPAKRIDLDSALQYGTAQGYPPLYTYLRQFTRENLHPNCPYAGGPDIVLTCGNTDGFNKVLQALTNEWSGEKDWLRDREGLLVEEFCYMNAVQAARPRGLNIVPVKMDDEGMKAEGAGGLRSVLEGWDFKKGKRPHLMYTVTMGQNPSSGVLSLQRRRELYALCSKYDIIIAEDDPYWYLQYPSSTAASSTAISDSKPIFANVEPRPASWKSSGYAFLDSLVPSSVSIDTDGRVIRLDTFSKTVAPGCRLGWITAQPALVERILRITETSTQQPSGFVQSLIGEMLLGPDIGGGGKEGASKAGGKGVQVSAGWKFDGFVRWLEGLRGQYERRMGEMCRVLTEDQYLVDSGATNFNFTGARMEGEIHDWTAVSKTPIYDFVRPVGGMFIWLRVNFEFHPLYASFRRSGELPRLSHALWVWWTTKPYRVLVSPGSIFCATKKINEADGWRFFRVCFSAIDMEDLTDISERTVQGVRAFWEIKTRAQIDELLGEDEAAGKLDAAGLVQLMGPC